MTRMLAGRRLTERVRAAERHFAKWATVSIVALATGLATDVAAQSRVDYEELGGTFRDGTEYSMRMPSNWNGTLVRNLDYASSPNSAAHLYLLEQGYAVSGTARHQRRWVGNYDPIREIEHIDAVERLFRQRFGDPNRVIQFGCSGGGTVGLIIAEEYPDQVDGVIAAATHSPIWLMNTWFDGWFALQALLAPDLPFTLVGGSSLRPYNAPLTFSWRQAINTAQQTPEGRARIALAFAVGQLPDWVDPTVPAPDRDDVAELQRSMYLSALYVATSVGIGGVSRHMFESAPGPEIRQVSWNDNVDYREFFENANDDHKRTVRELYRQAGLDLNADLERINAAPRVSADPAAVEFWGARGRISVGRPQIPVLRLHDIGDNQIPPANVQGYVDLLRANGTEDMVRVVTTAAPTHCGFTVAETAALFETMMNRLDLGEWGDTDPDHLNELARSLHESPSRFISFDRFKVGQYNRTWTPPWY